LPTCVFELYRKIFSRVTFPSIQISVKNGEGVKGREGRGYGGKVEARDPRKGTGIIGNWRRGRGTLREGRGKWDNRSIVGEVHRIREFASSDIEPYFFI
jgi:hypothetical protein